MVKFSLQDAASAIKIYPNPMVNSFSISGNEQTITLISIVDALGKRVLEKKNPTGEIDISNLTTGIYFVNITYVDGKNTRHKIIKR